MALDGLEPVEKFPIKIGEKILTLALLLVS